MSGFLTDHIVQCCVCGADIDTREEIEGGDPDGCELSGASWVCSIECWDDAVDAPRHQDMTNTNAPLFKEVE